MAAPDLLLKLLTAPGPPGHESEPARVWREAAEGFADDVSVDRLGTTVARVGGRAEHPLLAIVGHVDEIALLVSHVSDKGFLHVVQSGGWDPQVLVGQRVQVFTRDGIVPGLVGRKPPHLTDAEERKKAMRLKDLHVDIGAKDGEEARSMVSPGDQVLLAAEPLELPNDRLVSRALDNRLGVYVAHRGGAAGEGGRRRRRPGGRRGGGAGGDRRARRSRDGLRGRAGSGRGGGRDPRHRRSRRGSRRDRRARARKRPRDHARRGA